MLNIASTDVCSPQFPMPTTQILMGTLEHSAEHASGEYFKVCCLIPYYFTIFQPGQTSPGQSSDSQNVSQQQSSQQQPQPPTLTEATPQTQPIQPFISLEETQGE